MVRCPELQGTVIFLEGVGVWRSRREVVQKKIHFCFMTTGVSCLLGAGAECIYEANLGNFSLRCNV